MKDKIKSNIQNNSTDVTTVTDEQKNIKITSESTAVLMIQELGTFKCRKSNAGTKEQKEKMKRSWCYSKTKKGEWQSSDGKRWFPLKPGTKPRNWYEGPKTYNEPKYHECLKRMELTAEAVQYYASEDSCPGRSKKERAEWAELSKYERIVRNAEITAYPGKLISVKIVD